MTKYRAIRTNGYASKAEARRAEELELLEKAGKISDLQKQVSFTLLPDRPELGYLRPLRYVADFVYRDNESHRPAIYTVEDVKGVITPVYKLKKRLMAQLLGIEITEVK